MTAHRATEIGSEHKSLVNTIVEYLESQILEGLLEPGQRVIEQQICDQLKVSRVPLREAFRILENRGFLVREPRKGVTVTSLSLKEAIDIYTIRANLESLSTYLAVKKGDPKLVEELKRLHNEMIAVSSSGDVMLYMALDSQFHETLNNACDNGRLIEMITIFVKNTARYRMEVISQPGKLEQSIKNHAMLIRSIEEGNAEKAERLRKETILSNIPILEQMFREDNKK